ncbi:hypothetical protein FRC12_015720 [Ceratobasidium sp. 428]|nr:hypothetical protein FRC12_015720 [Ceratobasidium sp. 428]
MWFSRSNWAATWLADKEHDSGITDVKILSAPATSALSDPAVSRRPRTTHSLGRREKRSGCRLLSALVRFVEEVRRGSTTKIQGVPPAGLLVLFGTSIDHASQTWGNILEVAVLVSSECSSDDYN